MSRKCPKCGMWLEETDFFAKHRFDNELYPLCKDCMCANIEMTDPDTFMWIMQEFDVPYIKATWSNTANKMYLRDPSSYTPRNVMGQYLRAMNMKQYKHLRFADTDACNEKYTEDDTQWIAERAETVEIDEEYEDALSKRLASGEITEAQYKTMTLTNIADMKPAAKPKKKDGIPTVREVVPSGLLPEQSKRTQYIAHGHGIAEQLTEEDILYLSMKWGEEYTPEEWVRMANMYKSYANEYELNVDREETLRFMCMTTVKMEEMLKSGQITEYKNLSQVLDQLRKSGKFTEAQIKEDDSRFIDSLGELVDFCEREEGFIPCEFDPDQYPLDVIDKIMRDMKGYTYNLVKHEQGLGDIIETYIKRLEEQSAQKMSEEGLMEGVYTSRAEEENDALDYFEHLDDLVDAGDE